jgi:hypothetical protein
MNQSLEEEVLEEELCSTLSSMQNEKAWVRMGLWWNSSNPSLTF